MLKTLFMALFGLAVSGTVAMAGSATPVLEYVSKTLTFDGGTRSYELYVGSGKTLAVVLHGGGGRGKGICNKVGLELERPSWVIACPDSLPGNWNALGIPPFSDNEVAGSPNDIGFLQKLIRRLSRKHNIERVVVVGHSLGGMMAQALACLRPGLMDAIVLSATTLRMPDCEGSVAVLQMHSTAYEWEGSLGDSRIPWTCGPGAATCAQEKTPRGRIYAPALAGISYWAASARCSPMPTDGTVNGARTLTWQSCEATIQAVITDGCHGWPGAELTRRARLQNCFPSAFPGTAYMADWFDSNSVGN